MARALTIVRHTVSDFDRWHLVYDEVQPLRDKYGILDASVLQDPGDANDVTVLHWFPSIEQAQGFVGDAELKDAMARAGVTGPPSINVVVEA